jgi:hypothetical protein
MLNFSFKVFFFCVKIILDCVEDAKMRFPRSVNGYTRLDKIQSEIVRKELEVSGIQEVINKNKQNWGNRLESMDNAWLPKHVLNYQPRERTDRGRPSNVGNVSIMEEIKQPNPWRKIMTMIITVFIVFNPLTPNGHYSGLPHR